MSAKLKLVLRSRVPKQLCPLRVSPARSEENLVRLTVNGLIIREKGGRLAVGPFLYEILYNDSLQRQAGLSPIKAHAGNGKQVSRSMLSTGAGR